jgi:Na+/H+ antiporter NhaA
MAVATANMARTCQLMMQQEMGHSAALRPFMIGFAIALGALLVIALFLFLILEVQWIRLASNRIESERQPL